MYKGRLIKYPFENGLSGLPKHENFECLYSFVKKLVEREKGILNKPATLKEWFAYTFGEAIAEKYLVPYNEKIWKYPLDKMGLEWVERVPSPPIEDLVKSSLGLSTEGYLHQLHFYYPKTGGIQALIKAIEGKIDERYIIRSFEVKKACKKNGKWAISNGKIEKSYDRVISTIPIQSLVNALNAPHEIKEAASNLKYTSLITVMLGLRGRYRNRLSWLYIPDHKYLAHRVSFPLNYSPEVAPAGMSAVMAEITCKKGELWAKTDYEITKRVIEDLNQLRIIDKKDVCFSSVKRAEYAYVINDLNYAENIKRIRDYVEKIGIALVGRFSEFKYLNMDDCVRRSKDLVSHLTSYSPHD